MRVSSGDAWQALRGLRIGCVKYLNSRPLICAYDGPVIFDHPSSLAKMLAAGGLDADSDDALVYLTPILGPTATLLLHRLARYLTGEVAAQTWTMDDDAEWAVKVTGRIDEGTRGREDEILRFASG